MEEDANARAALETELAEKMQRNIIARQKYLQHSKLNNDQVRLTTNVIILI